MFVGRVAKPEPCLLCCRWELCHCVDVLGVSGGRAFFGGGAIAAGVVALYPSA